MDRGRLATYVCSLGLNRQREDHVSVALCISQVYFLIFITEFYFSINDKNPNRKYISSMPTHLSRRNQSMFLNRNLF